MYIKTKIIVSEKITSERLKIKLPEIKKQTPATNVKCGRTSTRD